LPFARLKFPFLIGTVRTVEPIEVDDDYLRFPFLIGTVRTDEHYGEEKRKERFPFLIGTVRTDSTLIICISYKFSFHSS